MREDFLLKTYVVITELYLLPIFSEWENFFMKRTKENRERIKRITATAMFAAIAYVSVVVLKFQVGGFLTFDLKDALIAVCGMYFGPLYALSIAVIVPFLEFITISGTGVYGLIMNILASVAFAVTASLLYKYKRTFWGAVVGLLGGIFAVVGIMLMANLLITPYYLNMPTATVASMIPTLLLPFNAVKAVINGALTLLLYKPLTSALKRAGFKKVGAESSVVHSEEEKRKSRIRSITVTVVALLIVAASIFVIYKFLGGSVSFFGDLKSK